MLHRLALALHRTVAEIEDGMSERELRDWYAFAAEHPLPDELADLHSALLCSIVANLARAPDSAPLQLVDFLILKTRATPELPEGFVDVELTEAERFKRVLGGR